MKKAQEFENLSHEEKQKVAECIKGGQLIVTKISKPVRYSYDEDLSEGGWVYFDDGHSEFWNNTRLEMELKYRGPAFVKTQTKLARLNLIDDMIVRLSSQHERTLFPLAGQEWRDNIIRMLEHVKGEETKKHGKTATTQAP